MTPETSGDLHAVLAQHVDHSRRVAAHVVEVSVPSRGPKRDLYATPTDHDRWRLLHRQRIVAGVRTLIMLAAEADRALSRHAIDDLDCLLEHFSASANQTWPRS
jgi:hypothetical protein